MPRRSRFGGITRSRRWLTAPAVAGALVLSACGGSTPVPAPSATSDAPSSVAAASASASASASTVPASPSPSAAPVRLDDATKARLQASLEQTFAAATVGGAQTPGAIAYVSVGDQEWISALGVSDVETKAPIDPAGHGRIGSITKPIVASAVLVLVDQGKLSLDDPLAKYIPGIANGDRITVRQLLSMSSGVWNYTTDQQLVDTFATAPMTQWTIDQTIDLIRSHPADFAPGEKVAYCDSNFVLLGRIAEIVTGQPISDVVRTLVTEPLGMTGTRMPADDQPDVPDPSIGSYQPVGGQPSAIPDLNPTFAWTAGAATSTVTDLARFAREVTDGSLLSPELQAQRLATTTFTGIPLDVGYGLGVLNMNDLIGHNGDITGGGGTMLRLPEQDATFVVLVNLSTNAENSSGAIANALIDDLYPGQTVHR
ncbi:serine hydrolase domain-containing protein [Nakamurella sp.]|uniref:serine hydrolase domain-containing protein n=1 Tax=Nakamurella sp. TaxID=1869182 RepID=UPI0037849D9D